MEKGFDHLRCPICGSELIYSEGTHDMCCKNNPYERISRDHAAREAPAYYGPEQTTAAPHAGEEGHIYKVWGKGGPAGNTGKSGAGKEASHGGRADNVPFRRKEEWSGGHEGISGADSGPDPGEGKQKPCVFALTFTESGRYGTLWSLRTVHDTTNYFSLMSLMKKIEKRQRAGEPLAPNVPNLPKKVERSAAVKLAFRYSIDVEDLYSIRYSSETAERLAGFYGLSVRDVRQIRDADIEEGG